MLTSAFPCRCLRTAWGWSGASASGHGTPSRTSSTTSCRASARTGSARRDTASRPRGPPGGGWTRPWIWSSRGTTAARWKRAWFSWASSESALRPPTRWRTPKNSRSSSRCASETSHHASSKSSSPRTLSQDS
eukprot:scaffold7530_cov239-Pinguiococcus_pyrenoidosus.AAC.2